ncbi:Bro-N domain-containing protein [Gallibacterium anatis]|uniref:BRO-N domain-containing protein n=1 Tax=Gallibacterium anatis TaxID=750 RepID=UPI0009B90F26|nr:Bro-N domain-containing protein [Gallibacterium anatis]
MSNQIQFNTFNFHSNAVRVITDPTGEFWFCGTDVCTILGYTNAPDALKKHCKQSGIAKRYISYPSGKKEAIFINEPNLYRLIIKSRKPEAEPFETWVFEEVLPQIRKNGTLSTYYPCKTILYSFYGRRIKRTCLALAFCVANG